VQDDSPRAERAEQDECSGCPLVDRRGFLKAIAILGAGAAAVAAGPQDVMALPMITGIRRSADEKEFPIPAADGASIDKDLDLILSRSEGKIFAFSLACPHQNTAIKWEADKKRFQCPKHHSIYTPEGVFVEGRATRGLDRFTVRKNGNSIVVNLDSLLQEDEDGDKWKTAFITTT
jgi:nitrite reductase/ring-hydroxylating ferredoxin subunit